VPTESTRVRVAPRLRVVTACAAAAALLAGCASAPNPSQPTDLVGQLPPTATVPPIPSVAPTSAATKPAGTRSGGAATAAAATSADWKLVDEESFGAGSVNTSMWSAYDSVGAFGNGRRSPSAISQSGGSLTITATADDDTSGGISQSIGQTYGRWEFRARTDLGRGFGSAILLWPDSEKMSDGEIDIMEVPNEKRDIANFVLHYGANGSSQVGHQVPGNFSQWHTFAVEWLPTSITWYVDGVRRYTVTNKAEIPTTPFHMAIQLDEGPKANWIAAPDATTPKELKLQVDYVKVWKWADAPAPAASARTAQAEGGGTN
jgi:beta-glucanase (GH16 family)